MGRQATDSIPLKPETKELVKEDKPDGWTFDYWVRRQLGVAHD